MTMAKANYLLGRAEKLVDRIPAPKIKPDKAHPYTLDRAKERLVPKLQATAAELEKLPGKACPNNEAVALLTLHPTYLAKSYFPDDLLEAANLRAVGSRQRIVSPDAWAIKNPPKEALTAELFVAGQRTDFDALPALANRLRDGSKGADDFIKVYDVRTYPIKERVRTPKPKSDAPYWEIILHATGQSDSAYILEGFREYLESLGLQVDLDERLHAQGLCFLPVRIPRLQIGEVAEFSFLRAAREMPRMRPVVRMAKPAPSFSVELPDGVVLDPTIRVAVFDGGLPAKSPLLPWANRKKSSGVGAAHPALVDHGHAVTSALLFGSLDSETPPPIPYAKVDHIRVFDTNSPDDGSGEYFAIIKRIMTVLESGRYDFVNFSIGPDLEIEDDNVHVWTAMLDQFLKRGTTLASFAVGNTGERDHDSGNARAQVPSDCVNAIAMGSADSLGSAWKRSAHSSIGPGRSPGIIKPDLLSFGGSAKNPFYVVGADGSAEGCIGTSFASPSGLRAAIGVRAYLGPILSPLALKALLIHRAYPSELPQREVGWGKIAESLDELVKSDESSACIVYQGTNLSAGSWVRAPIPVPEEAMSGMVYIKATICYATDTDPQDPIHYTRSGLEIRFRPHDEKRKKSEQRESNPKTFFSLGTQYAGEEKLRNDAHKWETTLHASAKMRGNSLHNPCFDIHYNARMGGSKASKPSDIQYALIVSITAPRVRDLYDRIVRRYRTILEALRPVIEIPIRGA
jgi:hypothetical protein